MFNNVFSGLLLVEYSTVLALFASYVGMGYIVITLTFFAIIFQFESSQANLASSPAFFLDPCFRKN